MRRTSIIFYGILGGAAVLAAGFGINHSAGALAPWCPSLLATSGSSVRSPAAGATPAAIGLLADVTEAYPDDRGAIMGLYSVFLGLGQIVGAILGGFAAVAWGLDGIFVVALVLLGDRARAARPPAAVRALRGRRASPGRRSSRQA